MSELDSTVSTVETKDNMMENNNTKNNNEDELNAAPTKIVIPDTQSLGMELQREQYKRRYNNTLRGTIYTLLVVAALSILIVTLWMPVLQVYGNSMNPVLQEGDLLISIKGGKFVKGDAIAFYYGNKLLVKRYIAGPSQWVNIDMEGNIYVDDKLIDEPYIKEKALGDTDIEYPYQVPEDKYFVMGDNRAVSVDSRNTILGCPAEEQIVGKIVFRVWPLNRIGKIEN